MILSHAMTCGVSSVPTFDGLLAILVNTSFGKGTSGHCVMLLLC